MSRYSSSYKDFLKMVATGTLLQYEHVQNVSVASREQDNKKTGMDVRRLNSTKIGKKNGHYLFPSRTK